ncbi:hypothetical protein YSY43_47510 [Paenibacillus sp. YSY-4.3]
MKIHIVKQGDTLFELSKKYDVPLQKLIEANPQISNPDELSIGMKVKIPASAVPVEEGVIYKHTVKQGDSLWKLAKAWGLPLQALVDANPQLSDPNVLNVGDVINIPGAAQSGTNNPSNNIAPNPNQVSPIGKKNTAPIENVKPENIKPENIKPENIKPENIKPIAENPKPAPIVMPESIKLESVKVENIQIVENVMPVPVIPPQVPQMEVKPIKYEEPPCQPKPHYPELISPYQFQVEQPPMLMAEQALPYPPCGCSGHGKHHENLYSPYQFENENVSSYYDFPPAWPNEAAMGEYPGLSNAPVYQSPQYMNPCAPVHPYAHENLPYHHHYHHQPHVYPEAVNVMPESYAPNAPISGSDNSPWGQAQLSSNIAPISGANVAPNTSVSPSVTYPWSAPYYEPHHTYSPCGCSGHSAVHPYANAPFPVQPYANAPYPMQPYQTAMPNVPMSPLGAFGVPGHMHEDYKGGIREDTANIQAADQAEERTYSTSQGTDTPQQAQKDANISEVREGKPGRSTESKSKKPAGRKKHSRKRNPWINN